MNESVVKRLGNLLSVKSLVTLTLTVVFAVMALRAAQVGPHPADPMVLLSPGTR